MPKAYTSKRSRRISAAVAVLLALLTWTLRDHIPVFPGGKINTSAAEVKLARPQIYYGPANSIAVLPFSCTSTGVGVTSSARDVPETESDSRPVDDPSLAEGIAEALIGLLEQVPGLQVTSLNSSFFFRGGDTALPVLAERLKVKYILEGCARQVAGGIEISARLHDMKTGSEKWSQSFNGQLDEVFAIQDEIAAAAVRSVSKEKGVNMPVSQPVNPQAWLLLLEGRHQFRLRAPGSLRQAERALKQALKMEPEFAPVLLDLARVYMDPASLAAPGPTGIERAREMILGALRLDPELAGAYLELSRIRRVVDWDWKGASEAAQKALELRAGNADVLSNASTALFTRGIFDPAILLLKEAIKRDPLVLQHLQKLGLLYEFSGNYEESLLSYQILLRLNPDYPGVHAYRARTMLAQSMPESALDESEREQHPFWQRYARILSLMALDRRDEADPLLQQMINEHSNDAAYQLAEIYAFGGDVDAAFNWLERAYRQRDGGMSELIGNHFLSNLEKDARWKELLVKVALIKR